MPPSAPNAEPPPSKPRSSSISPAPAPRLQARRPERARDPRDPSPARGSEPGDACPGLRSIPFARPSRAGRAAPSSLLGSAVQRPRLPARCPRRSRPCTPGRLPRTPRCADSFPLLAGARLQHRAPLPQPAVAAADPPPYSLPVRSRGRREGLRRPQPLLRQLRPGVRGRSGSGARSGREAAPAASVLSAGLAPLPRPARAASPPPARGREGARAQGCGRARATGASARLGAGLPPRGEGAGKPAELLWSPAPLYPGGTRPPSSPAAFPQGGGNLPPVVFCRTGRRRCVSTPQVFARPAGCSAQLDYKVKNAKNHPVNHVSAPRSRDSALSDFSKLIQPSKRLLSADSVPSGVPGAVWVHGHGHGPWSRGAHNLVEKQPCKQTCLVTGAKPRHSEMLWRAEEEEITCT